MQVKQRLRLNVVVMSVSIVGVLIVLSVTAYRVSEAIEASRTADAIISTAFERLALRTDYMRTGSERAREQVAAKYRQFDKLLKAASERFTAPEDKKVVNALIEGNESVGKIFRAIVANRKNTEKQSGSDTLSREVEDRLLSQLNMRVYETVSLGGKLQDSGNRALMSALRLAGGGIAFVFTLAGVITLINSWIMGRAVTDRIQRLRDGAAVIGEGNLDHRIDLTGNDEFADLSAAFNAMTFKLQGSRQTLEQEVTERKNVERALREAGDELELRVQERTRELQAAQEVLKEVNETLEIKVSERTGELGAANTLLRDSRRAALNIMEDALSARKAAEETSVKLAHEVEERKHAEEDVLKLSEDMAARNVELESVNRELEAFIYSISHDLRAPVRTMAGFARFLAEDYGDKLDEQAKDYLRRITLGSEKMTLLINDLLRLSKISRQEFDRMDIDLSKLASSVISGFRASDPGRSVEVSIAEGLTAFADLRLMEIVLSNLLGNAWKFTSKTGKAQIEFGARRAEGDTAYFVRDNGAGFNPEYMEKMFWPFQRLHTEEDFEGTGIGLTIVERIIRRHGGKVWAEGEVGKGATVYFTLGQNRV